MRQNDGTPLPRRPHIDRLAAEGDPTRFRFAKPRIPGLDYSFSGLKTSVLYTLRDAIKDDPDFIERNRADIAASLQHTIIDILLDKLAKAVDMTGVRAGSPRPEACRPTPESARPSPTSASAAASPHSSRNANSPPTTPQW